MARDDEPCVRVRAAAPDLPAVDDRNLEPDLGQEVRAGDPDSAGPYNHRPIAHGSSMSDPRARFLVGGELI